jgi:hypothetical protein
MLLTVTCCKDFLISVSFGSKALTVESLESRGVLALIALQTERFDKTEPWMRLSGVWGGCLYPKERSFATEIVLLVPGPRRLLTSKQRLIRTSVRVLMEWWWSSSGCG